MRLTVRTLLAWLDQVLPANDQRELGDKVAASGSAQQLAERMRRIVERPAVTAPRLDGKGLAGDANCVAAYLDNCLEPDRIEAFERICVESDVHLAEVTACHNILATLPADAGADAPLDADGRARLLAAMKHRSAAAFAEMEREERLANTRAVRAALQAAEGDAGRHAAHEDTVMFDVQKHGSPSAPNGTAPRRSSRGAWAAALVAMSLLAVLGILLVRSVLVGTRRPGAGKRAKEAAVAQAPAVIPAEPAAVPARPEPPPPSDASPPPDDAARDRPEPEATSVVPEPAAEGPREEPAEGRAVAAAPPAPASGASEEQPRVPLGDALAIAATAPENPAPATVLQPGAAPESGLETEGPTTRQPALPAVGLVGGGGVLLHKAAVDGQPQPSWVVFPPGADTGAREDLLVPAGFHPDLNVRGVTIRLLPGTRAAISLDADGTPRIEVVFGRAVVRASRGDARLGVTAGGLVGTITAGLVEPVGIEVELQRAAGDDPERQPSRIRAGITAVAGGIGWRQADPAAEAGGSRLTGIADEGMLDGRSAIRWDSREPAAATVERQPVLPAWIESAPQQGKLEKGACETMAAKVAGTSPLTTALRELAADKRAENRMIAVETLALLGDYDELVELLSADGSGRRLEGRQWLALESATVPLALARGTTAAGRLRKAFEDRAPHGKAEALYAMARGFTDEQLRDGADAVLVEALADADLVVRRYAFKCLCDIVQPTAADRLRYRPDGLPDLRRDGVNWWRNQLEKGLVRRGAARE